LGWELAIAALLFAATTAHAQTSAPAQAQGPSLFPLILTLIFVLALIPVAVWMLKRMGAGTASGGAGLRVVAQLPLGQRERIVVVEAGERWLVLGVTPSAINRIGTLPKGDLPPHSTPAASFASLLQRARSGRDNG
jgi:flagellar protein FliO/FliZ